MTRRAPIVLLAALALAPAAGTALGGPALERLEARDRALGRAESRLADRLDAERSALAATRDRIDALRALRAQQVSALRARLRALYAQESPDPVVAALAGNPAEAEARAALLRALTHSDVALVAGYRTSLADLQAAEAAFARRKHALAADQRALAARRAAVRMRLRAERRAERAEAGAGTGTVPGVTRTVPARGSTDGRGLPADVLARRSLPGAAPVDASTGLPITLDRPTAGPPMSIALPGRGVVSAQPGAAVPLRGPRRFTARAGIRGGAAPASATASEIPFAPDMLVAAHRTLPLGALLRLRRGDGEVVVRVVDRGPWTAARDLDVSPAAAAALGLRRPGPVRVEVLG